MGNDGKRFEFASEETTSLDGISVREARAIVGSELRRVSDEMEAIRTPRRSEVAMVDVPSTAGLLGDEVEIRLAARRQPALDAQRVVLDSAPSFGRGDLLSLGVAYLARTVVHRRALAEADRRVDSEDEHFSSKGVAAGEILTEVVRDAEDRRRQVARHIELSARSRYLMSVLDGIRMVTASDRIPSRGSSPNDVAAELVAQTDLLVARARLRVWLEALQRTGVSPLITEGNGSPLVRLMRQELVATPGLQAGTVEMLDDLPRLIAMNSAPSERIREAMDAVTRLRKGGMSSEAIVAMAASAVVLGTHAEDLVAVKPDAQDGNRSSPRL